MLRYFIIWHLQSKLALNVQILIHSAEAVETEAFFPVIIIF